MSVISSVHDMKTTNLRVTVYLQMYPPTSLIQGSIQSSMPDIRLSSISKLISDQPARTLLASSC